MTKDGAPARGLRTALDGLVALAVGMVMAIWAVPGVPEAVRDYLQTNLVPIMTGGAGLVGVIGYLRNVFFRKDVKNV